MRPYFFKQSTPDQRRIQGFRDRQWESSKKAKKQKGSVFLRAVQAIRSLIPRRLTDTDRWYLQRAEEKRARRRARNLRWWAKDKNWHAELAR